MYVMESNNTSIANYTIDPCEVTFTVVQFVLLFLYSILFFVAVGGNVMVCCVVLGQKRMRTVTNFFLLNLAIGDIGKGVICIPFTFVANVVVPYWPFGNFMCPFVFYMQAVVVFLSAFTLVAMSIDRYVAIIHPLREKLTIRKACLIILVVWILALAVPLPTLLRAHVKNIYQNSTEDCQRGLCIEDIPYEDLRHTYSMAIMCFQYFVPLTVLMITYSRIGYIIWIKRTPGEAERRRDERIASSKRKMVKMMIVVVIIYAVCWLPIHAIKLIEEANPAIYDFKYFQVVWTTAHLLAMSYACYNPIVYFSMNKRFRLGFKDLILFCAPCRRRFGHVTNNGRLTHLLHNRNNSHSSSRYSPRCSIEESQMTKLSFKHQKVSSNKLNYSIQTKTRQHKI